MWMVVKVMKSLKGIAKKILDILKLLVLTGITNAKNADAVLENVCVCLDIPTKRPLFKFLY